MDLLKIRIDKAVKQVLATCKNQCISDDFAQEAAAHTEYLLSNYDVLIHDAKRSGICVAGARQLALDSENRAHLRSTFLFKRA